MPAKPDVHFEADQDYADSTVDRYLADNRLGDQKPKYELKPDNVVEPTSVMKMYICLSCKLVVDDPV